MKTNPGSDDPCAGATIYATDFWLKVSTTDEPAG